MKVDLHCHTNISDCSFSFEEVLKLAVKEEVGYLAITNHDTTEGLEKMVSLGKEKGVEIIPAIEISAFDFDSNLRVHILGYFIEAGHPSIEELCGPFLEKRRQASYRIVENLMKAGYSITWDQVKKYAEGGTGVYKQHIMHALMDIGQADSIYGELYKKLFSRGENGETPGAAFVPVQYVDAHMAVKAIIEAGGVPVLAHPGQYKSFEIVPELVESGLQGIEVWHPHHGPDEEEKAKQLAAEYDLIMTGGSDFHGFYDDKKTALGSKNPGMQAVKGLKERKKLLSLRRIR